MKKIIGTALGIGMLLASVAPSFAYHHNGVNNRVEMIDTGPFSDNIVRINKDRRLNVNTNQTANVKNNVNSQSNSGGNVILGNTKVLGAGGTGNAISEVIIDNQVNGSETYIEGCGCEEDTKVELDQTGPGSNNRVVINANSTTTVNTNQNAKVENNVNSQTNTGGNMMIGNTKVEGTGSNGKAKSSVGIANWLNSSVTMINLGPYPDP